MQACGACSSAISFMLDAELQKSVNASGQRFPSRTMLKVRQNSKSCDFCNFMASEIQIFAQKRELDVKDDQTVVMSGIWKNYGYKGARTCSRILESIRFDVSNASNNASGQQGPGLTIGTYPVCIQTDNALSKYILTRLPDRDPLSDSSLERIRTWIDVCNTSHSACDRTDSFLPTRLIDISQYNQSEAVKLIESEGLNGQYVALSHCWGTSKSFTTTTKTLDQRKRGMMVQDLPKTFQDAIRVTDLLHVQYLWIDSICIIQDDPNDWEEQSGQMSQVYSNSYITIAAARSADDLEGFLGMRSDYLQVNVDFSLGSSKIFVLPVLHGGPSQTDIGKLNDMPLNTRAWTLQERYLSRRLLHFSRDQTYWECILGITSERGVGGERASSVDALLRGLLENNNDGASLSPTNPPWIGSWSTLVSRYSRRNLTIARDRLPALAGLARQIAEHTGDRYCAGLWWSSIGYDLCWAASFEEPQVSSRYEPERFLGPSWSWASVNVPITFLTVNERATLCAKFLSCELEISGQNPYGVVKGGRLKVKAPLVEIYPDVKNVGWPWWDRGVAYPCFALILWDTPSYTAVLVKPTLRMDGEYWKVGCASPLPQQGDRIPYSEDDIRTITLV